MELTIDVRAKKVLAIVMVLEVIRLVRHDHSNRHDPGQCQLLYKYLAVAFRFSGFRV
jgi:hypothetical protein